MTTLEIPERDIVVEIPSHWDEMSADQRLFCLKNALFASMQIISIEECRVRCLFYLAGISRSWRSVAHEGIRSANQRGDKYSRIYLLSEVCTEFLFKRSDKGELEISYDTLYNHFPELQAGEVFLYGPAHLLADLSFGEFRAALEEMQDYFRSKEEEALHRFVACLYRPERPGYKQAASSPDFDGLRREPFNRARIDAHAQLVAKVPVVYHHITLLWFTHVLQYIQREDLVLGGEQVNFAPLFPRAAEGPKPQSNAWTSLLHAIAKEGPFGKVQDTDRAGLFDVLLYMRETHLQNLKLKSKKP